MILAVIQVTLLLMTALRLGSFDKRGHRYRPFISFLAACWAGSCLALATTIILHWPETISTGCILTTLAAGASCAAAWVCGGNVAELIRRMGCFTGKSI